MFCWLRNNKKGQTVLELGIFGSIILLVFGVMLSYIQRENDQQYVQMEAFRRALQKANMGAVGLEQTFRIDSIEDIGQLIQDLFKNPFDMLFPGKGAAVQYTVVQNRRYVDTGNDFQKRSPQMLSASSSVYWAVPYVGKPATNLSTFKINDDAPLTFNSDGPFGIFSAFNGKGEERAIYVSFEPGEIENKTHTKFKETNQKQESPASIINTRTSELEDRIDTKIKFKLKLRFQKLDELFGDLGLDQGITIWSGTLVDLKQRLSYASGLGYSYSSLGSLLNNKVKRVRQWKTDF